VEYLTRKKNVSMFQPVSLSPNQSSKNRRPKNNSRHSMPNTRKTQTYMNSLWSNSWNRWNLIIVMSVGIILAMLKIIKEVNSFGCSINIRKIFHLLFTSFVTLTLSTIHSVVLEYIAIYLGCWIWTRTSHR